MDNKDGSYKSKGNDHGPVHPFEGWFRVESYVYSGEEGSENESEDPDIVNS